MSAAGGPNDFTTVCVGSWRWNQQLSKWVWEGNCQPGVIGGPSPSGRRYIPPPNAPPGQPGGQAQWPFPPKPSPPPPSNPQSGPVTGDPPKTPPGEQECGPAMSSVSKYSDWRLGYKWQDDLNVPAVGGFGSVPIFTTEVRVADSDPNKSSKPTYDQFPTVKYNKDGTVKVWHQGHGPGVVVFHPPQLKDYHWYGDEVLPGSDWPTKISQSTLLILSGGNRFDGLAQEENIARNLLAFGLAHRTKNKPVSGVYFRHNDATKEFCIQGTDSAAEDDNTWKLKWNGKNLQDGPSKFAYYMGARG